MYALLCLTPLLSHCKIPFFVRIMSLRLPRVASGTILVSLLGCRLRFRYEAGGMFRILIGFILCLEF
jgi:acyl-CoA synthetase (AMP-forming)/AMP-acid ligase II